MKQLIKNKKGMSPLIATIVLIAFAVALGAVVMNIGKTISPEIHGGDGPVDCSTVKKLAILEVNGNQKICFADRGAESYIDFTISNSAPINIEDIHITIFGSEEVFNKETILTNPMKGGEGKRIKIKYDPSYFGSIEQVSITPKITDSRANECHKQGITLENIQPC